MKFKECDHCGEKATFMDNIWHQFFWCADCESDAAWQIYNEAAEENENGFEEDDY